MKSSNPDLRGAVQVTVGFDQALNMLIRDARPGEAPSSTSAIQPFGPEEYDADSNMGPFVSHNEWGTDHFSFRVHEDLDAFCDKIRARGASFSVEPYPFMPGSRIAYLQAPDNVSIELVQGPLTPSL